MGFLEMCIHVFARVLRCMPYDGFLGIANSIFRYIIEAAPTFGSGKEHRAISMSWLKLCQCRHRSLLFNPIFGDTLASLCNNGLSGC